MIATPNRSAGPTLPCTLQPPSGNASRRRACLLPLAVATAWVFGCDDPLPPVACGTVPEQTVTTGEEVLVKPCFEDPEMGVLTLAAVSSNPEVATAGVLEDNVRIAGVSPGTATIAVTATDPDMLEGELNFDVLVPNRAPVVLEELPPDTVPTEGTVRRVLSPYFSDPDSEPLTFGATSSDTLVAAVALSADTLAVAGISPGAATVTVTATDPGGLSATARMEVAVYLNRPPVVDYRPRKVEMLPGDETERLPANYFSDPDGDSLTFGVTSSDTLIVTIAPSADDPDWLTITAISPGAATVTFTATDPGGLSATAKMEVVVPRSAPLATREVLPSLLLPKQTAYRFPNEHFRHPYGKSLTYSATVSDSTVASLSVGSGYVKITAVSPGRVTVTVTATDADGQSATTTWKVGVIDNVVPFRDDFDSDASLENWAVREYGTTAVIDDGKLRLTNPTWTTLVHWATAQRPIHATDWTVAARMGNITGTSWVQLVIEVGGNTGADGPNYYLIQVGEDRGFFWPILGEVTDSDWRIFASDSPEIKRWFDWHIVAYGLSEEVAPVGELMDVTVSVKDGAFSVVIGDEEVFISEVHGAYPNIMRKLWLSVWPKSYSETASRTGFFDWVEVTGSPYTQPQMPRTPEPEDSPAPGQPPAAVERPGRPERQSGR